MCDSFIVQSWIFYSSRHKSYSASSSVEHGNKSLFSPTLRYFDLKDGIANCCPHSYEELHEIEEYIKQKIVDILSKCKLDFAHLSTYLANATNVNFGKLHSVYELLIKEKHFKSFFYILLLHTFYIRLLKRGVIYLCCWDFHNKIFGSIFNFLKVQKHLLIFFIYRSGRRASLDTYLQDIL